MGSGCQRVSGDGRRAQSEVRERMGFGCCDISCQVAGCCSSANAVSASGSAGGKGRDPLHQRMVSAVTMIDVSYVSDLAASVDTRKMTNQCKIGQGVRSVSM